MTNQEWLCSLSAEEFLNRIKWLLQNYGKRWTDSDSAIIEWLQGKHEVNSEDKGMTREEMWEEFESQLKREVRTPATMNYDDSIRLAEMGIKDVVKRWKKRLEQEPCVTIKDLSDEDLERFVEEMKNVRPQVIEQEPCEDCISRQAVHRKVLEEWNKAFTDEDIRFSNIADFVIDSPSVTPTQKWIPVSERLPKVMDGTNGECSDDVLICVADDEHITISTGFYGYYPRNTSYQGWWSMWAYGCHQLDSEYKVIAWMPLPQPYKAESESE